MLNLYIYRSINLTGDMFNFYDKIQDNPENYRQLSCGDSLFAIFNCPLEHKYVDLWTKHNYIVYVTEGRKVWHTSEGSFDLRKGSCAFIKKGASIVEQFFDTPFCLIVFFVHDDFISETLKTKSTLFSVPGEKKHQPVIFLNESKTVEVFFQSMSLYFSGNKEPDQSLLELKFRELILMLADDPANPELLSYFSLLLREPQSVSLHRIMESNYCFNLKLEEYAAMNNRSLSAFKRDFQKEYATTPGKWLLEKRLTHAKHLLANTGKSIGEVAFESGFESTSHFSRSFKERFGIAPTLSKQMKPA
jgi:AraC-like DNA-binding protein